ncbi:hypothetical protein ABZS66_16860 [Dactylosporangium sp. NPDC005572]|uniref:hypothetical protein n=1 Tax=Dactylosporangium sp. NPDC005572 TaxID=3156889 RepID=UPI0033A36490
MDTSGVIGILVVVGVVATVIAYAAGFDSAKQQAGKAANETAEQVAKRFAIFLDNLDSRGEKSAFNALRSALSEDNDMNKRINRLLPQIRAARQQGGQAGRQQTEHP